MSIKELLERYRIGITYSNRHIEEIIRDDFPLVTIIQIQPDKHAYACITCGCIYQSKNIETRNLFDTNDPKTKACNEKCSCKLVQICECDPIV